MCSIRLVYLCGEHAEELQQLKALVLDCHGSRADDAVQGFLGHHHQRHQPHLHVALSLHILLQLKYGTSQLCLLGNQSFVFIRSPVNCVH